MTSVELPPQSDFGEASDGGNDCHTHHHPSERSGALAEKEDPLANAMQKKCESKAPNIGSYDTNMKKIN